MANPNNRRAPTNIYSQISRQMKAAVLLASVFVVGCAAALEQAKQAAPAGKTIAFNRGKGNCLACHQIEDGEFPGTIGPPLRDLKARFTTRQQLREQIWDATRINPETSMPPFGRNKILSESEIDLIVDYLWGLE